MDHRVLHPGGYFRLYPLAWFRLAEQDTHQHRRGAAAGQALAAAGRHAGDDGLLPSAFKSEQPDLHPDFHLCGQ